MNSDLTMIDRKQSAKLSSVTYENVTQQRSRKAIDPSNDENIIYSLK